MPSPKLAKSESPDQKPLRDIPTAPPPSPTQTKPASNPERLVDAQELLASALEYLALTVEEAVVSGNTSDPATTEVEERSAAARKRWERATKRVVSAAATLEGGSGGSPAGCCDGREEGEAEDWKPDDMEGQGQDDGGRDKRKRSELSPLPNLDRVRRPRL